MEKRLDSLLAFISRIHLVQPPKRIIGQDIPKARIQLGRWNTLHLLKEEAKSPSSIDFFSRQPPLHHPGSQYVFSIPLHDGTVAYMRQEARFPEERAVVICDPKRFLDMWKLSGRRPEILGLQGNWNRDPKLNMRTKGFPAAPTTQFPWRRSCFVGSSPQSEV